MPLPRRSITGVCAGTRTSRSGCSRWNRPSRGISHSAVKPIVVLTVTGRAPWLLAAQPRLPGLRLPAEALGHVAVLVNNAGVTGRLGPIDALADDALRRVVDTNLVAPVRLCREAARRWQGRDAPSHIVNITSVAARTGSPGEYVAYAATKAALDALTVGLARELAPQRIHVNAVSPGTIDTTIHARAGEPDRAARVAERIPMRRPGQP